MISRENYLQQLIQFKDTDFIKVISGVRRSGKSVLLMQYRDYLQQQGIPSENILYLNFESFEYQWVKDTHILKSVILFLLDNVGQLVNPSKISNTLTSERIPTSNHTISKYLDFIARKADEILYVQVAFEIPENTHETDNLLHIKDNYKKVLITEKYYEQIEIDGIEVMYVVDWLLQ